MPIQFQTELVDAEHDLVPIKREYEKAPLDHAFDIGQVDLNYVFGRMRVIMPGTKVDGETEAHVPVCDYDSRSTFLRIREMFRRTYEHAMATDASLESNEGMGGDKLTDSDGMALTSVKATDLSETFVRAIALTALGGSLEDIELVNKMAVESSLKAAWSTLPASNGTSDAFNSGALTGDFGGNSKLLKNFLLGEALGYATNGNNNREHCDSVGPVERQLEVASVDATHSAGGTADTGDFVSGEFAGVITLTEGAPRAYSEGDKVLVWDTNDWAAKFVLGKHPDDGDDVSRNVAKGGTELYVNAAEGGASPLAPGARILIAGSPLVTQVVDNVENPSLSTYQDGWVKQLMRRVFRLTQSLPERAERFERRRFAKEGDPLLSDGRDESLFITTRMQAVVSSDGAATGTGVTVLMRSGLWRKALVGCKVYLLEGGAQVGTVAEDADYGVTRITLDLTAAIPGDAIIQIETVSEVQWLKNDSKLQIKVAGLPAYVDSDEWRAARDAHEDAKKLLEEVASGDELVVRGSGDPYTNPEGFDGVYTVGANGVSWAGGDSSYLDIFCTYDGAPPDDAAGHQDVSIYKRTGKPDETDPRGMRDLTFVTKDGNLTQDESECPWGRQGDAIRLKPRFHNKDVITLAMQLTVKRRNADLAALNDQDKPTRRFGLRIQHLQAANTQDHDQVTDGHMESIMAGTLGATVQTQLVTQPERILAEAAYGITVQEFIAAGKYTVDGIGTDMWTAGTKWLNTFINNYGDDFGRTEAQRQAEQVSTQAGLQLTSTDVSDKDLLNDADVGLRALFQARLLMVTARSAQYNAFVDTSSDAGADSFLHVLSSQYALGAFDQAFLAADSNASFREAAIAILNGRVATFDTESRLGQKGHLPPDPVLYHGLADLHAGLQDMTTTGHEHDKAPYSAYDLLDVLSTALRTVRLQTISGHASVELAKRSAAPFGQLDDLEQGGTFITRALLDLDRAEALAHGLIDFNRYKASLNGIYNAGEPQADDLATIRKSVMNSSLAYVSGSIHTVQLALDQNVDVNASGAGAQITAGPIVKFSGSGYKVNDIILGDDNKKYKITEVRGELAKYEELHADVKDVTGLNAREELLAPKLIDLGKTSLYILLHTLDPNVVQADVEVENGVLDLKPGLYEQVARAANSGALLGPDGQPIGTEYRKGTFDQDPNLTHLKANLPTAEDNNLATATIPDFEGELEKIRTALDDYHEQLSDDKLADLKLLLQNPDETTKFTAAQMMNDDSLDLTASIDKLGEVTFFEGDADRDACFVELNDADKDKLVEFIEAQRLVDLDAKEAFERLIGGAWQSTKASTGMDVGTTDYLTIVDYTAQIDKIDAIESAAAGANGYKAHLDLIKTTREGAEGLSTTARTAIINGLNDGSIKASNVTGHVLYPNLLQDAGSQDKNYVDTYAQNMVATQTTLFGAYNTFREKFLYQGDLDISENTRSNWAAAANVDTNDTLKYITSLEINAAYAEIYDANSDGFLNLYSGIDFASANAGQLRAGTAYAPTEEIDIAGFKAEALVEAAKAEANDRVTKLAAEHQKVNDGNYTAYIALGNLAASNYFNHHNTALRDYDFTLFEPGDQDNPPVSSTNNGLGTVPAFEALPPALGISAVVHSVNWTQPNFDLTVENPATLGLTEGNSYTIRTAGETPEDITDFVWGPGFFRNTVDYSDKFAANDNITIVPQ